MSARELDPRCSFTPSLPAAIEISRMVYDQCTTDDTNFQKVLLPEYVDYYMTACIWMRLTALKKKNGEVLTPSEQILLDDIQVTPFCLPDPILKQIMTIGNVKSSTGQHLYVTSPPLPTAVLGGFGGYYGALVPPGEGIDNTIHNLYEEVPCLGVLAEAIRNSIGNGPPGLYESNVTYNGRQPGPNLLGFQPLNSRRNEAKNLAFSAGVTNVSFRDFPENSGYNADLMAAISNVFATTKTFKTTTVVFPHLEASGSLSQLTSVTPVEGNNTQCVRSSLIPSSQNNESPSIYGEALFFCPRGGR